MIALLLLAQSIVTWTAPTEYTDGTPLDPTIIMGYRVQVTVQTLLLDGQESATSEPQTKLYCEAPLQPSVDQLQCVASQCH